MTQPKAPEPSAQDMRDAMQDCWQRISKLQGHGLSAPMSPKFIEWFQSGAQWQATRQAAQDDKPAAVVGTQIGGYSAISAAGSTLVSDHKIIMPLKDMPVGTHLYEQSRQAAPSDLHAAIMNIPSDKAPDNRDSEYWYKEGHRDARHAAAELALVANAAPAPNPLTGPLIDLLSAEKAALWGETDLQRQNNLRAIFARGRAALNAFPIHEPLPEVQTAVAVPDDVFKDAARWRFMMNAFDNPSSQESLALSVTQDPLDKRKPSTQAIEKIDAALARPQEPQT